MTPDQFQELLKRSESDTLDFKLEHYEFGGTEKPERRRKQAVFVKDILAIANTPRSEPAFIVLGVKRRLDGTVEHKGLPNHVDDNTLQQQVEGLIYPHPKFRYIAVTFAGKQFAVIEIPIDRSIGPFFATEEIPGESFLRQRVLYVRRNSKNAEADPEESKAIYSWFLGTSEVRLIPLGDDSTWDRLLAIADLSSLGRRYILILSPGQKVESEPFKHLGWIDWQLVADFDVDGGVLNHCHESLERRRAVHRITLGDQITGNPSRATFWYFARGIRGREATLRVNKYNEWIKAYGNDLREKLVAFAANGSEPVVLIALWNEPVLQSHLRKCLETATEVFADALTQVIVTEDKTPYARLAEETEAQIFEIANRHFLEGLAVLQKSREVGRDNLVLLPGRDGVEKEVAPPDVAWLEEDLELVHLAAGTRPNFGSEPCRDFLKGAPLSWFELGLPCDVQRDKTTPVQRAVSSDLTLRKTTRINLYHLPGAGGSTVAKRVVWNLHLDFPVVVLKRCEPRETVDRIAKVFAVTEKPVLILREGSVVSDTSADQLAELLAARNIPGVLFQVLRRHSLPQERERVFSLQSKLSIVESERFRAALTRECPASGGQLGRLCSSEGPDRTPFIFGLTAFAEGFAGLKPYVGHHLRDLSQAQKEILQYFSIAHVYGHQTLSQQHFADVLRMPHNRPVQLRNALSPAALGLIVEVSPGHWRTAHDLVAREVLKQTLAENLSDERNWNTRLADLACSFAEFCHSSQPVQPNQLLSMVERVFFYRDDAEVLGTVRAGEKLFSQLINDIPEVYGRRRVFKRLVELFPEQAHYWAHLGRFESVQLRNYEEALAAIERAISLQPEDHVLHHMKGMAIRSLIYSKIAEKAQLAELLPLAKQASDCFEQARSYSPDDEHGFISEAQMITRVLDYARAMAPGGAVEMAASYSDPWLREAFQRVEDLLFTVRQQNPRERPSEFEELCRAELDKLYGAHEQALQRWQNLLDRRDRYGGPAVKAPPIRRQIVWTYLSRNERRWEKLQPKELRRSVELLEANLQEEPSDDRNIRLWIQAARFLPDSPSLESVIERVAYWKSNGDSLDAVYYLYVLHALAQINGSVLSEDHAVAALEECQSRARFRRDRTRSFEWLGNGTGIRQLVHQDQLGDWDRQKDFWVNTSLLKRSEGIVSSIRGPQAGEIELTGRLKAFFVPGVAGMSRGRSENLRVTFFLGFSFDGPRAWSVEVV